MAEYKDTLRRLCQIMTIPGYERRAVNEIREQFSSDFDSITLDRAGNIILYRQAADENAQKKKIMLDAHMDEVGMIVSSIKDGGFLTVAPVGGIDTAILPTAEVNIYGKETIYGVFACDFNGAVSHSGGKPSWKNLRIDTGYSKEELEKIVKIGTPVGYRYNGDELLNERITGRSMDDKCCGAALIQAVLDTPRDKQAGDVYITLSSKEEIGGDGALVAANVINPDIAVITDVNFAQTPGVDGDESGALGDGAMVSLSAVTDRTLTSKIVSLADSREIKITTVVEATSTGTNANSVYLANSGVPVAVVSIPNAGMHSYNELIQLSDAAEFIKLISAIITDSDIYVY